MSRVLITGAARRIGAAIAHALAEDGWHVIAHYNRSADEAARLAAAIGPRCDIIQANLANRTEAAELIPACLARFGPLDALINNASSFRYDTLQTMTAASWDAHLTPNLESPILLAQAFARAQASARAHGRQPGAIINMLDHKIAAPNPDFFSYTVAKLALSGATTLLAQALGQDQAQAFGQDQALNGGQIRVNAIAPGITLLSGAQSEAGFQRAWTAPPLGRSSTPAEIADACRYILATRSLNGQTLVLDGGDSLTQRQRDIAFDQAPQGAPGNA